MHSLVVQTGNFFFRHRNWAFPALIAGLFAVAIPPSTLFGSERLEEAKDCLAILIVLAGLTLRALVIGQRHIRRAGENKAIHAAELFTNGLFSLCRNPLYTGNVLIVTGIFLMHGNVWTMVFGTTIYTLIYAAMISAEEDYLRRTFGAAYVDYCNRVPRWVPNPLRLRQVTRGLSFNLRRVLIVEYTNIGIAVAALALTEFYEEVEEPLVGGRTEYIAVLLGIVALAVVWIGVVRLLKKRHILVAG